MTRERRYYNLDTLKGELLVFEERYGMTSEALDEACLTEGGPADLSSFDRLVWLDTYREVCRLSAASVPAPRRRRTLQPAG